jgi:hypothetical protein
MDGAPVGRVRRTAHRLHCLPGLCPAPRFATIETRSKSKHSSFLLTIQPHRPHARRHRRVVNGRVGSSYPDRLYDALAGVSGPPRPGLCQTLIPTRPDRGSSQADKVGAAAPIELSGSEANMGGLAHACARVNLRVRREIASKPRGWMEVPCTCARSALH